MPRPGVKLGLTGFVLVEERGVRGVRAFFEEGVVERMKESMLRRERRCGTGAMVAVVLVGGACGFFGQDCGADQVVLCILITHNPQLTAAFVFAGLR